MTEIICEDLVNLSVIGETPEEIIQNLATDIDNSGRLFNLQQYVESVLEREELTSTGIGFGISIPHGKTDAVKQASVAFGRLKKPVDWKSLDDKPVEIVFLLAVPEKCAGNDHLKIIAGLSRKLIHEDFRELLQTTSNPTEIVNVINESLAHVLN